jgi:CheY-like chemotaxis protein/predicted transcriptional regulator
MDNYDLESPKDYIGGQRSKFDVMATVLHICQQGSLKNHIIGKGNFSDAMVNHYLSILLYHNLIDSLKDENGRTYYITTEKGLQFLRHYRDMQEMFRRSAVIEVDSKQSRSQSLGQAKRILVVDDEDDITSAMRIGLEDSGFKVDVYNDPLVALFNYRPGAYDLLILDVKMPKMNGFELYKEIKKHDEKAEVCFLTAFEMYSTDFKKNFPAMDEKRFIQKPVTLSELVEKIRNFTDGV